jgi:hypothetical protein
MKCLVLMKLTTKKKGPNKFIKEQYEAPHQMLQKTFLQTSTKVQKI